MVIENHYIQCTKFGFGIFTVRIRMFENESVELRILVEEFQIDIYSMLFRFCKPITIMQQYCRHNQTLTKWFYQLVEPEW